MSAAAVIGAAYGLLVLAAIPAVLAYLYNQETTDDR